MNARLLSIVISAGVCAVLLGVPNVHAASGRISFSGAVVESTCAVNVPRLAAAAQGPAAAAQRLTCGQTAVDAGRSYTRSVVNVDATLVADDRLLAYVAGGTMSAQSVRMVVHTYE